MENYYLECDCTDSKHTLRFILDEEFTDIIIDVQLNKRYGIFGRIWRAVKYIFGYDCQYGHWDEFMISGKQVEKLRDLCNKHLEQWRKINGPSKVG